MVGSLSKMLISDGMRLEITVSEAALENKDCELNSGAETAPLLKNSLNSWRSQSMISRETQSAWIASAAKLAIEASLEETLPGEASRRFARRKALDVFGL